MAASLGSEECEVRRNGYEDPTHSSMIIKSRRARRLLFSASFWFADQGLLSVEFIQSAESCGIEFWRMMSSVWLIKSVKGG